MRGPAFVLTALLAFIDTSGAASRPIAAGSPEATLAVLDMAQKELVARADAAGLEALSAPELTINAPTGRILSRAQFLDMMRTGQIAAETFERHVEQVTIGGDVGVVMGSEVFTPTAGSELGRRYGAVPLARRYTNVYVSRGGRWLWFARHANVMPGGIPTVR